MKFGHHICDYQEEMQEALAKLIAIPSVCGEPKDGMPYGECSAQALQCILDMAREMGFAVKNAGNYAGHAEYDCGRMEMAAVLTHVDVVPPGMGWDTDPFTLSRKGNLLFGRGVLDDKGAAVVSLYCLKALKDHNVAGKRKLRAIFGAGEEIGMDDLKHYFREEPLPDLAFTPDSDYGICNREKGILHGTFSAENDSSVVLSFQAGSVVNAVPERAVVLLRCDPEEWEQLRRQAAVLEGDFTLEETPEGNRVVSKGTAAHAMCPEEGFNAATHLIGLLASVFSEKQMGALLAFLRESVGTEWNGASLGIQREDEPSGPLTLNVGIVRIHSKEASASVDIRFPVTAKGQEILEQIWPRAKAAGIAFSKDTLNPPLYLPETSPLISILQRAYESVMGEKPSVYATGGGTYARTVQGRCVAFGPVFPDEPDRRMHNSNEHIDWERFLLHAQICLEAMYRMITE